MIQPWAFYVRVSTREQAEGFSPEGQEREIAEYLHLDSGEYVVFFDTQSGGNEKREQLQELLAQLERFCGVAVWRLDRLSRRVWGGAAVVGQITDAGLELVSVHEKIDTQSAMGKGILSLYFAMAESEREKIAERASMGMRSRAEAGHVNPGKIPYGYRWVPKNKEVDERGHFEIDPREQAQWLRMARWAVRGIAFVEIARNLNAEGVEAKEGGEWTSTKVSRVLRSPLVRGLRKLGEEYVEGSHQPLTADVELWKALDDLFAGLAHLEGRGRGARKGKRHLLAAGFGRCGFCGGPLYLENNVYRCRRNHEFGAGSCPMPSLPMAGVDAALTTALLDRHVDIDATAASVNRASQVHVDEVEALRNEAEREADRALRAALKLRKDFERGGDDAPSAGFLEREEARYSAMRTAAKQEAEALAARAGAMKEATEALLSRDDVLARLREIRDSVASAVGDGRNVAAVRTALLRLFERATVVPTDLRTYRIEREIDNRDTLRLHKVADDRTCGISIGDLSIVLTPRAELAREVLVMPEVAGLTQTTIYGKTDAKIPLELAELTPAGLKRSGTPLRSVRRPRAAVL